MRRDRIGFTLIELLVVIAIMAVLMGLLMSAIQRAREAAARIKCADNLKQIGLATHHYSTTFGRLPPIGDWDVQFRENEWPALSGGGGLTAPDGAEGSWLVHLLPFLEQEDLYQQFFDAANLVNDKDGFDAYDALATTPMSIFICPSDGSNSSFTMAAGGTSYASGSYVGNVEVYNPVKIGTLDQIMTNGTSNTIMVAERILYCDVSVQLYYSKAGSVFTGPCWAWIYPDHGDGSMWAAFGWRSAQVSDSGTVEDLRTDYADGPATFQVNATPQNCDIFVVQSVHAAMQVGLGDGSVRSCSPAMSRTTWINACTADLQNPLGDDW
jgi:prepilin-type N-terminal cleavage/methylation domain-containing protein